MQSQKYPKAFEKYWYASDGPFLVGLLWTHTRIDKVKHQCYLAWQAGRKHQRRTYPGRGIWLGQPQEPRRGVPDYG